MSEILKENIMIRDRENDNDVQQLFMYFSTISHF